MLLGMKRAPHNKKTNRLLQSKAFDLKDRRKERELEESLITISLLEKELQEVENKSSVEGVKDGVHSKELKMLHKELKETKKRILDIELELIEIATNHTRIQLELEALIPKLAELGPTGSPESPLSTFTIESNALNSRFQSISNELQVSTEQFSELKSESRELEAINKALSSEIKKMRKKVEKWKKVPPLNPLNKYLFQGIVVIADQKAWARDPQRLGAERDCDAALKELKSLKKSNQKLQQLKDLKDVSSKLSYECDCASVSIDDALKEMRSLERNSNQISLNFFDLTNYLSNRDNATISPEDDDRIQTTTALFDSLIIDFRSSRKTLASLLIVSQQIKSTYTKTKEARAEESRLTKGLEKTVEKYEGAEAERVEARVEKFARLEEAQEESRRGQEEVSRLEKVLRERLAVKGINCIKSLASNLTATPSFQPRSRIRSRSSSRSRNKRHPNDRILVKRLTAELQSLSVSVSELRNENTFLLLQIAEMDSH